MTIRGTDNSTGDLVKKYEELSQERYEVGSGIKRKGDEGDWQTKETSLSKASQGAKKTSTPETSSTYGGRAWKVCRDIYQEKGLLAAISLIFSAVVLKNAEALKEITAILAREKLEKATNAVKLANAPPADSLRVLPINDDIGHVVHLKPIDFAGLEPHSDEPKP